MYFYWNILYCSYRELKLRIVYRSNVDESRYNNMIFSKMIIIFVESICRKAAVNYVKTNLQGYILLKF